MIFIFLTYNIFIFRSKGMLHPKTKLPCDIVPIKFSNILLTAAEEGAL